MQSMSLRKASVRIAARADIIHGSALKLRRVKEKARRVATLEKAQKGLAKEKRVRKAMARKASLRPKPKERPKPKAQPAGESFGRTDVVGSLGSPHRRLRRDPLDGTLGTAPGRFDARVQGPPASMTALRVSEMGPPANSRLRSPHGKAVRLATGDVVGDASLHRDFSEDCDANLAEGVRHRGVPTELGIRQREEENGGSATGPATHASSSARPGVPLTQTTLPWQVSRREAVPDSVPPAYCLRNRSNYCYLNSVAVSLRWAMLSAGSQASDYGSLGPAMSVLTRLKKVELAAHAHARPCSKVGGDLLSSMMSRS